MSAAKVLTDRYPVKATGLYRWTVEVVSWLKLAISRRPVYMNEFAINAPANN